MIPISDENPGKTIPYVTYALIVLNVLAYIYDRMGAHGMIGNLWDYSMIPASVIKNTPITLPFQELYGNTVTVTQVVHHGLNPQWLTIFTSMFMHGSLMHIGGNMLYLWIFGNNIEDALGHVKFLIFYLMAGALAALAHIASNPSSIITTVGASGAIAGVLGAYLYLYPRNRVKTLVTLGWFWDVVEIPAYYVLGAWFVLQVVNGAVGWGGLQGGGVAYWAHVGGFVAGVVLILILGGKRLVSYRRRDGLSRY
jgi:membrane associated rhomboid family serine protease